MNAFIIMLCAIGIWFCILGLTTVDQSPSHTTIAKTQDRLPVACEGAK